MAIRRSRLLPIGVPGPVNNGIDQTDDLGVITSTSTVVPFTTAGGIRDDLGIIVSTSSAIAFDEDTAMNVALAVITSTSSVIPFVDNGTSTGMSSVFGESGYGVIGSRLIRAN